MSPRNKQRTKTTSMSTYKTLTWRPPRKYRSWEPCVDKAEFRERVKDLVAPEDWDENEFERLFFNTFICICSVSDEQYEDLVVWVATAFSMPF